MGRISHTWSLTKSSWSVLQRDRELLVLPLLGGIAAIVVFGAAAGLLFASGGFDEDGMGGLQLVILAIAGILSAAIVQFFAGAVVGGAMERLDGGDPTVGSAVSAATNRFPSLFGWGAMDWTVGAVLRAVRERAGFLGDLIAALAGMAWGVVSFLVLPVIMAENLGPVAALKRSTSLLRQTWGENLLSQFGFGIIGVIAMLPGILVGALIAAVLPPLGIILIVGWIVLVAVVMSALTAVFKAVLYRYATAGETDPVFGGELAGAFSPK